MNKVVNKKYEAFDVYIGRGSAWGNPFRITARRTREQAIEAYRYYLWDLIKEDPPNRIAELQALDGKTLGCYCSPKPCHGDVIAKAVQWALAQK